MMKMKNPNEGVAPRPKVLPRLKLRQNPPKRNEFYRGPFRFYGVKWESKPAELVSLLLFCSIQR